MSVGFCGTPIYTKKKHLKCLWGSVVVLILIFQCLWDFCVTQYTKKKHLQCLWGSVVVFIIIFQYLFDVCVSVCLDISKRDIFTLSVGVCGTIYTKKNHLQCLWGSVVVLIIIF